MSEEMRKLEFVERVAAFKNRQKDERVKNLIDQFCLYYLHLKNIVDSDLPLEIVDDVRGRVQWMWRDSERKVKAERR